MMESNDSPAPAAAGATPDDLARVAEDPADVADVAGWGASLAEVGMDAGEEEMDGADAGAAGRLNPGVRGQLRRGARAGNKTTRVANRGLTNAQRKIVSPWSAGDPRGLGAALPCTGGKASTRTACPSAPRYVRRGILSAPLSPYLLGTSTVSFLSIQTRKEIQNSWDTATNATCYWFCLALERRCSSGAALPCKGSKPPRYI
jgi:hypothetical protein